MLSNLEKYDKNLNLPDLGVVVGGSSVKKISYLTYIKMNVYFYCTIALHI